MSEHQQQFDKNNPEVQEILMQSSLSSRVFAKALFPDEVDSPFSTLHDEIFRVMDGGGKKKAIAAPRGLGKTTLAKLRVCKAILFREVHFIIYLSNSSTSAEMQTENIKRMLLSNIIVKNLFGSIKVGKEGVGVDDTFSKKAWTAFGEIFILPRGAGQQVRGLNWMGHRPGLIVIDDLENSEEVKSEDQREKLELWFHSDLLKTESKYGEPAEFLYIDTIKHEASLLQKLIDSSDWDSILLSICDKEFNTYDENYMTTEEIKKDYELHRQKGLTDTFFMEYMNIPISLEDAVFKPSYFKYFEEEGDRLKVVDGDKVTFISKKELMVFVIVDPAKTVKLQSAESAVVTVGVHRQNHKIFVLDIFSGKVMPDQLYNEMFDAVVTNRAFVLAVEVTSLHSFISQPIESEMRVRGVFPIYHELLAKGKKEERVASLSPLYRLGYIYHNKNNCTVLENQLQWFPKSKLWDVMDAFAYVTKLMEDLVVYFDPEGDIEEPEDYDELEDEALLEDDWRVA